MFTELADSFRAELAAEPERFAPPKAGAGLIHHAVMKTMPALQFLAKSSFSAESFVHAVAPSPNELSFAM